MVPIGAYAEVRTESLWWLPSNVTVSGHKIDSLFIFIFWLTTGVFVAVQAVMIWFMIKYRQRKGVKAIYSHGNGKLEVIWTAIPAAIFLGLWIYSNQLWYEFRDTPAPEGALTVEIVGEQYGWNIRYPGTDGKLGAARDALLTKENKIGLDASDPAGQDDIVLYNDMVIPVGKPVHLILRSRDVIHAFYVPEFRLYQDLVPGSTIGWVWFETTGQGKYSIACSQLCGSGHYNMQGKISVVSPDEYEAWLAKQKPLNTTAQSSQPALDSSLALQNQ